VLFVLHIRECDLQVQAFGKSFVSATSITRQCFTTSGMICRVSFDYDYCSLLESKDVKIQIESLNSFGLVKTVYKPVSVCDVIDAVRRRSASPLPHHLSVSQPGSGTLPPTDHGKAGLSPVTDGDMTTFPWSVGSSQSGIGCRGTARHWRGQTWL